MSKENLLYIEDANKRKLFYRFTSAAIASQFVPLIVVLADEVGVEAPHFEYKMWNVLTLHDSFTVENTDLLQKLIKEIAQEYECEDHIYLYGSGMGGYGAILHGILCKANAVYANAPFIGLSDSKKNDLSCLLNTSDSFPIFYLCNNNESSLEAELGHFVDACKKNGIKLELNFCQDSEDDETKTLKKVLNMFERMQPKA